MGARTRGDSLCALGCGRWLPTDVHCDDASEIGQRSSFLMIKLCDINPAAREKLPSVFRDKSGIGVHYVDAFIAPMNASLPDNLRVSCKRKGLRVTLRVGAKKGDGLMRRLDVSADPVVMLKAALQDAAKAAGVQLEITDNEILIAP